MGYSNEIEVQLELASVLTSGNPVPGSPIKPMIAVGKSLTDTVPITEIQAYIRTADQIIDASVSSIYQIPLSRVNAGSFDLLVSALVGDGQLIIKDSTIFTQGDLVVIRSAGGSQELTVTGFPNDNTLSISPPLSSNYAAGLSIISRLRYPDPIPKISARIAAANLYDKHFAAQVEPDQSDFGIKLRQLAYDDLNEILAGSEKLLVPEAGQYVGRRYQNMALLDTPSTKAESGKKWKNGGSK